MVLEPALEVLAVAEGAGSEFAEDPCEVGVFGEREQEPRLEVLPGRGPCGGIEDFLERFARYTFLGEFADAPSAADCFHEFHAGSFLLSPLCLV